MAFNTVAEAVDAFHLEVSIVADRLAWVAHRMEDPEEASVVLGIYENFIALVENSVDLIGDVRRLEQRVAMQQDGEIEP